MTRRDFIKTLCLGTGAVLLKGCGRTENARADGLSADQGEADAAQPAYRLLEREGKLAERVDQAYAMLEKCELCPRRCGVNRRKGELGFCRAPGKAKIASHSPHYGEERALVGRGGSGTIFFSNCNLRCVFCQNWPIAHEGRGREIDDGALANLMLDLQRRGCHNINVVTPTHVLPNILGAVRIAHARGLRLPICYNTGGYELPEVVKLLDGVVDIYLPDLKFMDGEEADRYIVRGAKDYPDMAQKSIAEMHRQVGDLVVDKRGVALRGVMVRHLVMPNHVAGTREFVAWIAKNLTGKTYVNIMSQYRVEHQAFEHERIARAITSEEFVQAIDWALAAGLTNIDDRAMARYRMHKRRV